MTHQQPTTVAILGANTLPDRILARLLKDEGYNTKLLDAYPTGHINEVLEDVDVLLLFPYLDADLRGAFLDAMKSTPEAAQRIPVVSLSVPLQMALLDELSVNVSWQSLFEGLVQEIGAALRRAEASAEALPVDTVEVALKGKPSRRGSVSLRGLRVAFSQTTDGDFEEALRLCPCNHRPEAARGADYYCEESERAKNISREKPASRHPSVQVLLLRT